MPKPSSSSPYGLNCLLSPDCRGHVFRFLSYFECLKYSETSKTSLEHVIIELDKRRSAQFLIRPCEELTTCMKTIFSSSSSFAIQPQDLPPNAELISSSNTSIRDNSTSFGSDDKGNDSDVLLRTTTAENKSDVCLHRLLDNNHDSNQNYDEKCSTINIRKRSRSFYALPSVLDRIEGLYRNIPNSHPFNKDLRNLISNLKNKIRIKNDDDDNNNLIQRLVSVTYAHRLHATLLSRCTVQLEPDPYYHNRNNHNNNNNDENESFTVTLERYMGDVLSARCLIGHSYIGGNNISFSNTSSTSYGSGGTDSAGNNIDYDDRSKMIVEGGPSFDRWMDHLMSFQIATNDNDNKIPSAKGWYQYWVFFHSALLRVSPLSIRQANKLKIGPLAGIVEPFDDINVTENEEINGDDNTNTNQNDNEGEGDRQQNEQHQHHQDPWFLPSRTFACYSCECRDVKVLSDRMSPLFRNNDQKIGILQTTINHFGPLGPTFRGRDRVSTQVMLPHKLYVILLRNSLLSWTLNNNRLHHHVDREHYKEYVSDLRRWLNDSDKRGVMRWMKLLQDQSQKTHPMTVQPPLITIRMTTLNNMERQQPEDIAAFQQQQQQHR